MKVNGRFAWAFLSAVKDYSDDTPRRRVMQDCPAKRRRRTATGCGALIRAADSGGSADRTNFPGLSPVIVGFTGKHLVSTMPSTFTEDRPMSNARGFTLVEMMTATAVAATLASAAVPSMSSLIARQKISSTVNELMMAIDMGRSEAATRGSRVVLAPRVGRDWSSGWTLYRDLNDNGEREDDEPVLREFGRPDSQVQFSAHGVVDTAIMSFEETGLIRRAGSNGLMLGRLNIELDGQVRTVCFGAARVRVVANQLTCVPVSKALQ
jgi:type IV fimbrial biogenesis protein FimT